MAAAARLPRFVVVGSVVSAVALQGCAAPGQAVGQSVGQTVRVETPGCPGARCELSNDLGRWVVDPTPGSVTLTTSSAPLQVHCSAGPQRQGHTVVPASTQAAGGGGAVAGGLAGGAAAGAVFGVTALSFIPVLGVVILLTGVAAGAAAGQAVESGQQAIRYTDVVVVTMACPSGAGTDRGAAPGHGLAPIFDSHPDRAPGQFTWREDTSRCEAAVGGYLAACDPRRRAAPPTTSKPASSSA